MAASLAFFFFFPPPPLTAPVESRGDMNNYLIYERVPSTDKTGGFSSQTAGGR